MPSGINLLVQMLKYKGNAKYYLLEKSTKIFPLPEALHAQCPLICNVSGLAKTRFKYMVIMRPCDGMHCFCGSIYTKLHGFDSHSGKNYCEAISQRKAKVEPHKRGGMKVSNNKGWADIKILPTSKQCEEFRNRYTTGLCKAMGLETSPFDKALNDRACQMDNEHDMIVYDNRVREYRYNYTKWAKSQDKEHVKAHPMEDCPTFDDAIDPKETRRPSKERRLNIEKGSAPPVPPIPPDLHPVKEDGSCSNKAFYQFYARTVTEPPTDALRSRPQQVTDKDAYVDESIQTYLKTPNKGVNLLE